VLTLPSFKSISCLLISGEKERRRLLSSVLNQIGIVTIHEADSVDHASLKIRYTSIDLVIWASTDDGHISLLKHIRRELSGRACSVPFLCVTEGWDSPRLIQAQNAGASGFATLPLTLRDMLKAVSAVLGDPREFIKTEAYVGPDRRRQTPSNYQGPRRRSTDGAEARAATARMNAATKADAKPAVGENPPPLSPVPTPKSGIAGASVLPPLQRGDGPSGAIGDLAEPARSPDQPSLPRRRVQVVQEALRISNELQILLGAPTSEEAKAKIGDHFNRLMNLMGLIHGYCVEGGETIPFFKSKYDEIMGLVGTFSLGILLGGLERTVHESSRVVDGTVPAALGSSSKVFYKMSEFENLVRMLGGYAMLSTDMIDLMKTGWQNVLSLAALDNKLNELDGSPNSSLLQVASQRLGAANAALKERIAADSQEAAFKRLRPSS